MVDFQIGVCALRQQMADPRHVTALDRIQQRLVSLLLAGGRSMLGGRGWVGTVQQNPNNQKRYEAGKSHIDI